MILEKKNTIKNIFICSVILKLLLLAVFSSEYSSSLFLPFVQIFIDGHNNPWQFYFEHGLKSDAFPYHSVMLYILALPVYVIKHLGLTNPFVINFIFKFPLFLADLIIYWVLVKLFCTSKKQLFIFYFLNPIVIYAIYIHSQLDIIPISLLIVTIYFLLRDKMVYYSIAFGFALATKLNILLALPLLTIYLLKTKGLKQAIVYTLIPLAGFAILDLPYLFSPGFLSMVLFSPKQSLLFSSFYNIGKFKLLLPIATIAMVYINFFSQRKVNDDLLFLYFGLLFSSVVFFVSPAPAWYIWLVPFISIYFIKHKKDLLGNRNKTLYLHCLLSTTYIVFFVFFYQSEYQDILFLGLDVNFKIESHNMINLSFTLLEVSLVLVLVSFYKYSLESNYLYKRKENLIIGIGGDSGVGKTTFLTTMKKILGSNLLHIEGDADHKWERGDKNWSIYTHLDPKANDIHKQAELLLTLKQNQKIKRREYDHRSGKFTEEKLIIPSEYIAISGLHPFYLPKLRSVIDLKIYLDTDEKLRRHWKVIRDSKTRGYAPEKVLAQIEERMGDAVKYIYPQKKFADVVIRYFPVNDFTLGDEHEKINMGIRVTINANIHIDGLLARLTIPFTWDYNEDLTTQFVELKEPPNINHNCLNLIENFQEITAINIEWETGYKGFVQILLLKIISEKLKGN